MEDASWRACPIGYQFSGHGQGVPETGFTMSMNMSDFTSSTPNVSHDLSRINPPPNIVPSSLTISATQPTLTAANVTLSHQIPVLVSQPQVSTGSALGSPPNQPPVISAGPTPASSSLVSATLSTPGVTTVTSEASDGRQQAIAGLPHYEVDQHIQQQVAALRAANQVETSVGSHDQHTLSIHKTSDLALWCSFLVSFYGLLRKSNSVPKSSVYDPTKVLTRRHLKVDPRDNIIYMYIGFSKTNQFGAKDLVVPILGNNDPALDPVRHIQSLFSRVPAQGDSPAFSYGPNSFINYSTFTSKLKALLTKAGYDASLYSGHSLRRGGATFLHACGGSALMIQASGDWSSQCFTRYLFLSFGERLRSQALIASGISATAPVP